MGLGVYNILVPLKESSCERVQEKLGWSYTMLWSATGVRVHLWYFCGSWGFLESLILVCGA